VEALLPAFIAAVLGEWGDKTQLLLVALAARYGRPGQLLIGVALAALAASLLAAFGGTLIHGTVTLRALSLLLAVALVFAGGAAFIRARTPAYAETLRGPAVTAAALGFFLAEFGDRTQFITFAVAARYDSLLLAAAGATLGIVAASVPAAVLGPQLAKLLPVKALRYGGGALFLVFGLVVGLNALRLV
jgi:putative Ca2+/H+ antiporter (TMEM165/GDT1 family)